jgi:hypothetical protein
MSSGYEFNTHTHKEDQGGPRRTKEDHRRKCSVHAPLLSVHTLELVHDRQEGAQLSLSMLMVR